MPGNQISPEGPDHLLQRFGESFQEPYAGSLDLVSRALLVPPKLTQPGVPRRTSTYKVVYFFLQRMITKLRFISLHFPLC